MASSQVVLLRKSAERAATNRAGRSRAPSGTGGPRPPENHRQVDAPGKEPDQVQAPVENKGKLVVVDWITFAQKAKHLLVDEVEIEEAVDVARGGNVAYRVTRAWIAQPGENVPGRGDGKEEQNAGEQAELTPAAPISGEQQVRHGGEEEKDRSHQPLGQHGQRQSRPGQVKAEGFLVFQPDEKIVKSEGQQEGKQDFGNEDAGEQKNSHAGQNAEGGIERRALAIGATAPGPGQNGQAKHPQGQGQMGGEYVVSEEVVIGGGQPIRQRRFFQVADAIHFQRDPVAAARHMLGGGRRGWHRRHPAREARRAPPHAPRRKPAAAASRLALERG